MKLVRAPMQDTKSALTRMQDASNLLNWPAGPPSSLSRFLDASFSCHLPVTRRGPLLRSLSSREMSWSEIREVSLLKIDIIQAATTISKRPGAGLPQTLLLTAGLSMKYKTKLGPCISTAFQALCPPFRFCVSVPAAVLSQIHPLSL